MMQAMDVIAEGLRFPEGPVVMVDGSVLLVELARQTLSQVRPDGTVDVVADLGGGPNGVAIGPDSRAYVCNNGGFGPDNDGSGYFASIGMPAEYVGGSIQVVDLATGAVEVLYTECDGHRLSAPNDIVFDDAGGFWFTDLGKTWPRTHDHGGVYYATPGGASITQVIYPLITPNGVGLSPDGDRLYVAETDTGMLYEWSLSGPGTITSPARKLVHRSQGRHRFDSLAVDSAGHVCVGTLGSGGGITAVDPEAPASPVLVETGDPLTTNICFGGPDLRTAYLTCSRTGTLRTVEWPRPGLALNY